MCRAGESPTLEIFTYELYRRVNFCDRQAILSLHLLPRETDGVKVVPEVCVQ